MVEHDPFKEVMIGEVARDVNFGVAVAAGFEDVYNPDLSFDATARIRHAAEGVLKTYTLTSDEEGDRAIIDYFMIVYEAIQHGEAIE